MRNLILISYLSFLLLHSCSTHPAYAADYYKGADGVLLPNPRVTPGKADSKVTQENIAHTICQHNYTAKVRHVTEATKLAVLKAYGLEPSDAPHVEIDHLVSLEIGGANDAANLWPQPYQEKPDDPPGARAKDVLENWLHKQVCSGALSLKEAQAEISHNWYVAYQNMQSAEK